MATLMLSVWYGRIPNDEREAFFFPAAVPLVSTHPSQFSHFH